VISPISEFNQLLRQHAAPIAQNPHYSGPLIQSILDIQYHKHSSLKERTKICLNRTKWNVYEARSREVMPMCEHSVNLRAGTTGSWSLVRLHCRQPRRMLGPNWFRSGSILWMISDHSFGKRKVVRARKYKPASKNHL